MTDHERTVAANGLDFAVREHGDGDRLALCLHGFPDDAGSMDPLAERLADAGFTAVAPYMRGYGPTDAAPESDYSARALGADAVALADRLVEDDGYDDAVLVGHDWGAVAGYSAARLDPDRFSAMATMAVPPRFGAAIWNHPTQFLRSWYVWFFQLPGLAERTLRRDDFAMIEVLWNLWSPGWDYPEERIESVTETFRTDGTADAALQYYRQFVNPLVSDLFRNGRPDPDDTSPIAVPGLVIAGADDGCIGPELFADAGDAFAADARVVRIRDAGHFVHQEQPDVVAEEVIEFCSA
ncbi:alpha/beta fold hydrolase [Halorientalis regularis]|uniref:Pimeloyl-ACP methyl ester carboxylesterase n=1 Tax=Halorientalis regularis TaxID=660518 RepID=A0A1G7M9R6_9EURY|nr:alpha/beta hydrolase [Halorientalis regularis]SDF58477.1 Pimeloyl-ACP methyl ester carboxylesterase [Halorientalis regularis]